MRERNKTAAVKGSIRDIVMVGENQAWIDLGHSPDAGGKVLGTTVENGRRQVNVEKVTGKKVAGK
jgi:hypothetical protein